MTETMKYLKLCKYSFRFKTNIAFLILFLAIGVINELVTSGTEYLGGFYIVLTSVYMFQFIMSLSMSDMIQASGIGRRIHLDVPVMLNVLLSTVLYTLLVIYRFIMAYLHPEKATQIATSLLMIDIMFFVLFIYTGFVYKYFLASLLVFAFTFVFVVGGSNFLIGLPGLVITMPMAAIIGYVAILAGAILQYLICKALVNKPISQRAFRGIFKEAR
jgi:hypothetical protein